MASEPGSSKATCLDLLECSLEGSFAPSLDTMLLESPSWVERLYTRTLGAHLLAIHAQVYVSESLQVNHVQVLGSAQPFKCPS